MVCPSRRLFKLAILLIGLSVATIFITDFIFTLNNEEEVEHSEETDNDNMFGLVPEEQKKAAIYLPAENPTDLPIIVWWTPFVPEDRAIKECSIGSCLITKSRTELTNPNTKVSVFMFYGSDLKWEDLPLPRAPHHMWAILNEESPKNNWVLATERGIRLFNYTSTYSRYSSYSLVLHYLHTLQNLTQTELVPTHLKSVGDLGLVVYIQSDCNPPSDRDTYVEELMKYVKVDSYGQCLHNKDLPDHLHDALTFNTRDVHDVVAKYKFAIAFENAICHDYITEKYWRPLYAGTVPIVRGSPTIKDWAPTEQSIIVADDFDSPKELAEFLLKLDRDDDEYNKYLEFKRTGVTNKRLLDHLHEREWGVDDDLKGINFIEGFQCFVCDELHRRRSEENPKPLMADKSHCECPMAEPSLKLTGGTVEERISKLSDEAKSELEYWRYVSRCAKLMAAVLESTIGQGNSQDEVSKELKNTCDTLGFP